MRLSSANVVTFFSLGYFFRGVPHLLCGMKLVSNKISKSYLLLITLPGKYISIHIMLLYCWALRATTVIMESTRFDYSTKNIPLPSGSDYSRKLIEKTDLCRRMRWKAYFYLNPDVNDTQKQIFGFASRNTFPILWEEAPYHDSNHQVQESEMPVPA